MSLLLALLLGTSPVPGTLNPQVAQANIATTICQTGWTATIRPSRSWSYRYKRHLMAAQGLSGRFILDHKVPLELGGAPTDPENLMLQTPDAARAKDRLEDKARRAVCSGRASLADEQAVFLNWSRP